MEHKQARRSDVAEMPLSRRRLLGSLFGVVAFAHPLGKHLLAATEIQPLVAQVRRLIDAMAYLGEPLPDADQARLEAAANMASRHTASRRSSAFSTPTVCWRFASIRRAESRSSGRQRRHDWSSRGGVPISSRSGTKPGSRACSAWKARRLDPCTAAARAWRCLLNRSGRPTSRIGGSIWTRTVKSRWSPRSPVSISNIESSCSIAATEGGGKRRSAPPWAPAPRTSDSETGRPCSSRSRRLERSRSACATSTGGRAWGRLSSRTKSAVSTRRAQNGLPRISFSRNRSIARTARPFDCQTASSRSSAAAVPNTFRKQKP